MKQKTISMVSTKATNSNDPLRFPMDDYTEKTVTVKTSNGEREVTYRLYEHLTYVANPVDAEFQSLNVKVPIKVVAGPLMRRTRPSSLISMSLDILPLSPGSVPSPGLVAVLKALPA